MDRAVVAYLISSAAGTSKNIYPAMSSGTKELPHLVVVSQHGRREVPLTGLYRFTIKVMVKFPAALPPGQNNPQANRVGADELLGKAVDALMQSDNGQSLRATADLITDAGRALATTGTPQDRANNADMADFTCNAWYDVGPDGGEPDDASSAWVEMFVFEGVACSANVD